MSVHYCKTVSFYQSRTKFLQLPLLATERNACLQLTRECLELECSKARAERDDTRAETRFRLSPKRTSPFKSVRASVQSTAGSRGVRISLSNAE